MTIIFQNFTVFRNFFAFLHSFKTWKVCKPNSTLKIYFFAITNNKIKSTWVNLLSVKFLSAYLSVGYRKIANIRNSMQIRKPVVPKQNLKNAFPFFFGKMSLPHTVYFSISNFLYKLTQPTPQ